MQDLLMQISRQIVNKKHTTNFLEASDWWRCFSKASFMPTSLFYLLLYLIYYFILLFKTLFIFVVLVGANLTRVTSAPNSNTGSSHLIFSVPFSYFLFIFYLPRCILLDFPSASSLASLPFFTLLSSNNNNMHSNLFDWGKNVLSKKC